MFILRKTGFVVHVKQGSKLESIIHIRTSLRLTGHLSYSTWTYSARSLTYVEVSCDNMFDETNGSQVEQVDLDELDDEEAPCIALRNMSIGDVCPKESEEPTQAQDQPSSFMQVSPPTQDEDKAQKEEDEDQYDEPPQEEDIN
jgi:hypothetical protein